METFTLNIPTELLPTILEAVVAVHGLNTPPDVITTDENGNEIRTPSTPQTPEERAKELVVQFLGDIVVQYQQRQALLAVPQVDLSGIK